MKVTFDLVNAAVVYTNLTMKQHEANNEILGSYYEGLFMTMDEIIAKYGEPLINDDTALAYIINSDYVEYAFFYKDKDPNNCYGLRLVVKEGVSPSVIVDYLNSKYVVFASGTSGDGSKYAWTDGPDIAHSSLGVVYTPEKRYVDYSRLSNISQSKSRGGFDIDMELNSQTISKINEIREGARLKMERINTHKSQQVEAAIERFMNK